MAISFVVAQACECEGSGGCVSGSIGGRRGTTKVARRVIDPDGYRIEAYCGRAEG